MQGWMGKAPPIMVKLLRRAGRYPMSDAVMMINVNRTSVIMLEIPMDTPASCIPISVYLMINVAAFVMMVLVDIPIKIWEDDPNVEHG